MTAQAPTPPHVGGLIERLDALHVYTLALRRDCGRRGVQALLSVVVIALDGAMVFAKQAEQHSQQEDEQCQGQT